MSPAEISGLVVLAAAVVLLAFVARRRWLSRGGGVVDCSLRDRPGPPGRGWLAGLGRYDGDRLHWYRIFSMAPTPRRSFSRQDVRVVGRRVPAAAESLVLLSAGIVLECRSSDGCFELAMSEGAMTGFLSWLESAPPGVRY